MKTIQLAALLAAALCLAAPTPAGGDAPPAPDLDLLWSDPSFQREFLGSYGTNAEIEPRVDDDERKAMQDVLPLLESGQLEEAAAKIEALRTAESSAVIDFTLANIHMQLGRPADAAPLYESAVEKFPSFRRALRNLGLIRAGEGRWRDAIGPLSRVIQLGGGDGMTFGLLGYAYNATDQYLSAESAFRQALLFQPEVVDWKLGLTQSVQRQGKHSEAITLCDELLAKEPGRSEYWLLQANAYIGRGEPMRAAENFEIVRRMGKATPTTLYALGDIYVNASLADLAAQVYLEALKLDPDQDPQQPLRRIEALAQRNALEPSQALLGAVTATYGERLSEADRKRMLKLQARIAVAEGEGGQAVEVLEQIVALDPLDGEALILLGQHYARSADPERAIFYYERAESLDGFEADAKVRHAQLLVGESRYGEALPLLKRAQELQPREDVARYLEQIERVARTR
jgi:tetratricopeptide (TPR) repeat protein